MQVYDGLPILTNRSPHPARLVGDLAARPRRRRSASTRRSRTPRSTRSSRPAGRRSSSGGTGLYFRAALAELALPPAPAPGARERWEQRLRRGGRRGRARAARGARPGRGGARPSERPPPRRPRARARRGGRVARAGAGAAVRPARWRHPDARRRARRPEATCSSARIDERTRAMFEAGVEEEVRARARAARSRRRRARCIGLDEVADAAARARRSRRSSCARAAMPRTSASGCGGSPGSLWSLPTARRRRSPMRSSRWHAHGNVYLVLEGSTDGVDLSRHGRRGRGARRRRRRA